MKIALLGYGRMGKEIEKHAKKRNHQISFILDKEFQEGEINDSDVAINFSIPEAAVSNIKIAMKQKIPVVCGTTGWLNNYEEITTFCKTQNTAFLYASNFSIGVNIFFKINRLLAKLMGPNKKNYKADVKEIHHLHKLDSPSGTAITLAKEIIKNFNYKKWTLDKDDEENLFIETIREGEVPGTHIIRYNSEIDEISIKHKAFKRDGFALGAIVAAEWLVDKKGIYSMDDVLKINQL